jgi:hypothetical protein
MPSERWFLERGEPQLYNCALLYLDLLGVSALASGEDAEGELRRFDNAIRTAFRYGIGTQVSEGAYPAAVFSDSFVAAIPVVEGAFEVPEADAVFLLSYEAANMQTELAIRGYFARGAVTVGKFHIHDGLLFGPALVEAVELERHAAINPRIVLSPAAAHALRRGYEAEQLVGIADGESPLLVDTDGLAFVNYLERIFEDTESDPDALLRRHRDKISNNLDRNATKLSRWSKHCWAAEYHNATCEARRGVLAHHGDPDELLVDRIHTTTGFRALF